MLERRGIIEIVSSAWMLYIAIGISFVVAGVILDNALTYDKNLVTSITVNVWDRFDTGNLVWADISMVYPGSGYLQVSGDVNLCLTSNLTKSYPCPNVNNTSAIFDCVDEIHVGCVTTSHAGAEMRIRYHGPLLLGGDYDEGDTIGYIVQYPGYSSTGSGRVR